MCGIFGILNLDHQPVDTHLVEKATSLLKHRGPDDEGYLLHRTGEQKTLACRGNDTDGRISLPDIHSQAGGDFDLAFGHRRLSILDLSPGGHQPMASRDGRYWITYNGEIYNYLELRAELAGNGFTFVTTSDTEVLLAAFSKWGLGMLPRLVGMFAFALLDVQEQKLHLARDFFGIKPLFYTCTGSFFAFSSEIKPLLAIPGVQRQACGQTLFPYLRFGVTDFSEQTFFEQIHQVPAAHDLTINLSQPAIFQCQRYWEIGNERRTHISLDEAAEELRRLFLENVSIHLRSDVPVGACLSGGIDSSSIVMGMRRLQPELQLHTFSYIADAPRINEETWVDLAAREARAHIHKVKIDAQELANDLDRLVEVQEEPFGSTSIYAQYRVFRLARENGIKVMEDGQGADELFGGYLPYIAARMASLITHWKLKRAFLLQQAANRHGANLPLLARRSIGFMLPVHVRQFVRKFTGKGIFLPWVNETWFNKRGVSRTDWFKSEGKDVLHEDLLLAFNQTSLPMLLRYEDRNSMAFSIESRVPYLTPALAQFVFSLPEEFIIDDEALTKAVFRKAMRGLVPDAILDRREKIGFETPEKNMLSALSPWVRQTFSGEAARQVGALNLDEAVKEWQAVLDGQKRFDFRIWRMLNLIKWAEIYGVEFE